MITLLTKLRLKARRARCPCGDRKATAEHSQGFQKWPAMSKLYTPLFHYLLLHGGLELGVFFHLKKKNNTLRSENHLHKFSHSSGALLFLPASHCSGLICTRHYLTSHQGHGCSEAKEVRGTALCENSWESFPPSTGMEINQRSLVKHSGV